MKAVIFATGPQLVLGRRSPTFFLLLLLGVFVFGAGQISEAQNVVDGGFENNFSSWYASMVFGAAAVEPVPAERHALHAQCGSIRASATMPHVPSGRALPTPDTFPCSCPGCRPKSTQFSIAVSAMPGEHFSADLNVTEIAYQGGTHGVHDESVHCGSRDWQWPLRGTRPRRWDAHLPLHKNSSRREPHSGQVATRATLTAAA